MSDNGKLQKSLRETDLFDRYGKLLTEREEGIFRRYYFYDLSLSEIAEELGISRTAVSLSLKAAASKLARYEEKLGLCALRREAKKRIESGDEAGKILEDLLNGI